MRVFRTPVSYTHLEALGKSAQFEYRGGSASLLLALVLESTDFDDLVRNVSYLNAIMQYQSDEIAAQKERTERFNEMCIRDSVWAATMKACSSAEPATIEPFCTGWLSRSSEVGRAVPLKVV